MIVLLALIVRVASADVHPRSLPDGIAPGPGDTVELWHRGARWTRSVADGSFLDGGPADWKLDGGWEIDGTTVRRHGALVRTLGKEAIGAATDGEALWLRVPHGLLRVGEPELFVRVNGYAVRDFAPWSGGVAYGLGDEVVVTDERGQRRCGVAGRAEALAVSPDGGHLVVLGREGLAVLDAACHLVGGAPVGGTEAGFLDATRLLVVGTGGALVVRSWPALDEVSRTPPTVDTRWQVAQGPQGPVLVSGRFVFDPQARTTRELPEGALVIRERGLAFTREAVLDLGGSLLRGLDAPLVGPPTQAAVDGLRYAITDGLVVVQVLDDGRNDRWVLDEPVSELRLLPAGEVEVNGSWLLRPGVAAPDIAPWRPRLEDVRLPGGRRLAVAGGGDPHAIVSLDDGLQVVLAATFDTVGPPIPEWLEQAALSPDGRLLVGFAGGRVRGFEVATGREAWSTPTAERRPRLEVSLSFAAVVGDHETALLDSTTGAVRWTMGGPSTAQGQRRGEGALQIDADGATWRSDAWGGRATPPRWLGEIPAYLDPARGEPVSEAPDAATIAERAAGMGEMPMRVERALCRAGYSGADPRVSAWLAERCPPGMDPEVWPDRADAGGTMAPPLARLAPGATVALRLGRLTLPDGEPAVIVIGRAAELPSEAPRGVRMIRVVVDYLGTGDEVVEVFATAEVRRALSVRSTPEAMLVGATGRVLFRGAIDEAMARAPSAGLEEVDPEPPGALAPAWTLRAPSAVAAAEVLDGSDVLVVAERSVAVLSGEGVTRWTAQAEEARGAGGIVLLVRNGVIEARSALDGSRSWRRSGALLGLVGRTALIGSEGHVKAVDVVSGKSSAWSGPQPEVAARAAWFRVPEGWCSSASDCTERDPSVTFALAGRAAWLDGRELRGEAWTIGGIARVAQAGDDRLLVQLGSRAGPWALVGANGRLGSLLGSGPVAGAGGDVAVVGNGEVVRAYRLP